MNSAQKQIELKRAMTKLDKLTRSGVRGQDAVNQAALVSKLAQELSNIIAAEHVTNNR